MLGEASSQQRFYRIFPVKSGSPGRSGGRLLSWWQEQMEIGRYAGETPGECPAGHLYICKEKYRNVGAAAGADPTKV